MYLSLEDLRKGAYSEVIQVISRNESNALQAIEEAEAEVESYLSVRYDMRTELTKTPDSTDRNSMVIKLVRDIALYNCFNISNPVNMPENRIRGYENAIAFLKSCQSEKANIVGLKRHNQSDDGTTSSSYVQFGGNEKRNNQF